MKYRNLRIAWSAAWGVVAVLLCVLWVRSYLGRSSREIIVTPANRHYVHSLGGTLAWEREQRIFITVELHRIYQETDFDYLKTAAGIKIHRGYTSQSFDAVSVSYWLVVLISLCAGAIPWLPQRFSLRTLLIATTLIAVVLGIIVWMSRTG